VESGELEETELPLKEAKQSLGTTDYVLPLKGLGNWTLT